MAASKNLVILISILFFLSGLLATKTVSAQNRKLLRVPKEILRQLMKDTSLKDNIQLDAQGNAKNLMAEFISLKKNQRVGMLIRGNGTEICGAMNCATWVYRKKGKLYEMVLDAGSIQTLIPQRTFTKGYRDLMTTGFSDVWESALTLYKYDGKQYRKVECLSRSYRYEDKKGQMREWKRPQISRYTCD